MGAARRRELLGLPKIKPTELPVSRTPDDLQKEVEGRRQLARVSAAAIDFLYYASEDALRKQTQRLLRSRNLDRQKEPV